MDVTIASGLLCERAQAEIVEGRLSRSPGFAGLWTAPLVGEPLGLPSGSVVQRAQTS